MMVENQISKKIKVPRFDNEGEYTSDHFKEYCQQEIIVSHFTVKEMPQQNGIAKRINMILLKRVRCMLSNAGLSKQFWVVALSYATFIVNQFPYPGLDQNPNARLVRISC